MDIEKLAQQGRYTTYGTMAGGIAAKLQGIRNESIKDCFCNHQGSSHRLEKVTTVRGVKFINDSKATNTVSTYYALRSFEEPLRLILGGRDKGNDYNEILDEVKKRVVKIYTVGESAEKIHGFFSPHVETEIYPDFETLVKSAKEEANSGEVVLLSPACASFDMFDNFEHRGDTFRELVAGINQ